MRHPSVLVDLVCGGYDVVQLTWCGTVGVVRR